MSKAELIGRLATAIADGDEETVKETARAVLAAGIDPLEAITQGAVKGLDIIGERYQRLEAFLPDLIRGGDAMKACLGVFLPHVKPEQMQSISSGTVVIGTVSGDIHDIGKNLVASMLSVTGFDVCDIGTDVPVKRFIEKAEEVKARVIAMSALLTYSANYQKQVIDYLKDRGLREKYYVVVGGAPVSPEWAADIGADGYARTAIGAGRLMKKLVGGGTAPPLPQPLVVEQ
ncbi:MAG: corrinoid protein [Chloroflexi bacterium]|nr:corrinoid protein [Chloroflexota bacterium]